MNRTIGKRLIAGLIGLFLTTTAIVPDVLGQPGPLLPDWTRVAGLAEPPELSARAAVLLDVETRTVLFAKNPSMVLPAASLTKVIAIHAAMIASRTGEIDLDSVFEPPSLSWAENQPAGSSLMFLGPYQRLSLWELIGGLAVSSGNDAAVALALEVDGSVAAFADRMNRIVRRAGLETTTFVEPSGLNPGNVTTAYEYAAFLRMHLEDFPELLDERYSLGRFTYPTEHNRTDSRARQPITQRNRNLLLGRYPGADGVKTGYIDESGYHLAATAERDGRRLIAVVLGVQAASHDEGGQLRAADASALLDYGFDRFRILRFGHPSLETVRVFKGERPRVTPSAPGTIAVSVPVGSAVRLRATADQMTEIVAPVDDDARIGTLRVSLDGVSLAEVPITLPAVAQGGFWRRVWDSIVLFSTHAFGGEPPVDGGTL